MRTTVPVMTAAPGMLSSGLSQRAAHVSAWAWVWPALFVLHFFLPYIPGTRLRVEIGTLMLGLLFPLSRKKFSPAEADLLLFTGLSGLWALLRIGMNPSPTGHAGSAIQWINLNFPLLATGLYALLRARLLPQRRELLWWVLWASIANNLVACAQCYLPDLQWHSLIYQYYGGTISADYDELLMSHTTVAMSNAEFLARMGGRYTGLLATSHMLSVLNVWVCGTAFALFRDRRTSQSGQMIAAVAFALGLVGGMLSGGKMFYLGVAALFAMLLIVKRQFALAFWCGLGGAALISLAPFFLGPNSTVRSQIEALLRGDLSEVVATRYSATDGYLAETIALFLSDRNLLFFGTGADLGNIIVADSLFLLPLATGGLVQVALYMFPFWWLVQRLRERGRGGDELLTMLFCIHVTFVLSGIGVPVYQMGRLAPLFWIVTLPFVFAPAETRPARVVSGPRLASAKL